MSSVIRHLSVQCSISCISSPQRHVRSYIPRYLYYTRNPAWLLLHLSLIMVPLSHLFLLRYWIWFLMAASFKIGPFFTAAFIIPRDRSSPILVMYDIRSLNKALCALVFLCLPVSRSLLIFSISSPLSPNARSILSSLSYSLCFIFSKCSNCISFILVLHFVMLRSLSTQSTVKLALVSVTICSTFLYKLSKLR